MRRFISVFLIGLGLALSLAPWTLKIGAIRIHTQDVALLETYYADKEENQFVSLKNTLRDYNTKIAQEHQEGLRDPFDYENTPIDLEVFGLSHDLVGSIWIPRMQVELPLYWGASTENMDKGAALLGQTSFPMEQENTNAVIAAHRGHGIGNPMFRDIQDLQEGDEIFVRVPWTTFKYSVLEGKAIEASDIDSILIQEGKNLLTLQSCHPYPESYARYIVYARFKEEVPNVDKKKSLDAVLDQVEKVETEEEASSKKVIWLEDHIPYLGILVFIVFGLVTWKRRKKS